MVIAGGADALNQLECNPRKAFAMEIPKRKQIVLLLAHDNVWQVAGGGCVKLGNSIQIAIFSWSAFLKYL